MFPSRPQFPAELKQRKISRRNTLKVVVSDDVWRDPFSLTFSIFSFENSLFLLDVGNLPRQTLRGLIRGAGNQRTADLDGDPFIGLVLQPCHTLPLQAARISGVDESIFASRSGLTTKEPLSR